MEIEELKQNQNIIANKLIELTKESRKNRQDIEKDLEKIKDRDTKIAEQLTEAKKIVDTFSEYQRTFERTNFLNKVFTTIIFLFLIFLIWGSFLIYSQANHIKNLEKTISSNQTAVVNALLGHAKFWVDNENNIKWNLIKDIPEEVKNPKPINKKKGK
ncbi:hypothetical protein HS141_15910 [Cetobacterium somerae]|uniref:hypothetical protein n=1 Tax=Cetobacterium somerae TaxID=188913 RepID=UPI00211DF786|nr:hypothetical protein [Cetobacterium somerae]MCQ9628404.1 hypothetical protein [Cetobacterium somerae]